MYVYIYIYIYIYIYVCWKDKKVSLKQYSSLIELNKKL